MYWNTVKNNILSIYSIINVGKWNGVNRAGALMFLSYSLFQRHQSSGLIFSLTYLCGSVWVCTTCVCPQRPKEPSGPDIAGSGASLSGCWTQILCKHSVWTQPEFSVINPHVFPPVLLPVHVSWYLHFSQFILIVSKYAVSCFCF